MADISKTECKNGDGARWVAVAVAVPAHSALGEPLLYRWRAEEAPQPGVLVEVPLGKRTVLGVLWDADCAAPEAAIAERVRDVDSVLTGLPPMGTHWRDLIAFTARYYQRAVGEVALAALPPQLRKLTPVQLQRRLARLAREAESVEATVVSVRPELTAEQEQALATLAAHPGPFLLHGVTGSGKTEVYMRAAEAALAGAASAQVLVLVPEINLTPQLEARFVARFGSAAVVALHSGLTPAQRLHAWLRAHTGRARIVLGTRVAVLASLPGLALVVVDEEHDASYKQQEGARYSARDLAVYRGHVCGARVVLGSATPSLESWWASTPRVEGGRGRYVRLSMPHRVGADAEHPGLPAVRCLDMAHQPKGALIAPPLLAAMETRVAAGEQTLLLLNRRGWAPVLWCADCGWKSACPHCSAYCVYHRRDRTLRCHHCGYVQRVPRACPECGNTDIGAMGRGTEQLEAAVVDALAPLKRDDGGAVRVARLDADTTRHKGALEETLARVHAGEVDVLVGTQMIAKGHDFRKVTLVAALQPDGALFSSDFRAPERLFALLMQAAGRAGRDTTQGRAGEMWVQTHFPQHPLYRSLVTHDYAAFAAQQLEERRQAGMPPFVHLALLRAESRSQEVAQAFLTAVAAEVARSCAADPVLAPAFSLLTWYPAVPLAVQRVADVERAQMLVESGHRGALQQVLHASQAVLHRLQRGAEHRGVLRWAIDVDPLAL